MHVESIVVIFSAISDIMIDVTVFLHSRCGHLSVVRYLVNEAHCDPNVKNNVGWTPLHYACR